MKAGMNARQIQLVQSSWRQVAPIADDAASLFYHRLFEMDPSLKPMFRGDMKEQGRKLMSMITFAVNSLTKVESLLPGLRALGQRHGGYGVRDEHYETVGAALVWTLAKGLGPSFTAEVKEAWIAAYTVLANTMKAAAERKAA
jgi:hemoglobin-like flavoprotein